MMRAAIYARVSTDEQDHGNQMLALREYCVRRGWTVAHEYIDHETGKHANRAAFQRLFDDASKRLFDVVVTWALDRLTREGVYETFGHVRRLKQHGVEYESYTEAYFRTTGPAGELMMAVAAWIAKQERLRISERTKAGMERARKEGKHCGRPRAVFRIDQAREMYKGGTSYATIAEHFGVGRATVWRAINGPPSS